MDTFWPEVIIRLIQRRMMTLLIILGNLESDWWVRSEYAETARFLWTWHALISARVVGARLGWAGSAGPD